MKDMEQRVWQRVRGTVERDTGPEQKQLLLEAMEMASVYGHLLKQASEQSRELLRQLQEGERANIACLKGIARLRRQELQGKPLPPVREPANKLLEKCYHRSRRAAMAFLAQSAGGEFGEVYRVMADRERSHCAWIAQLMGMM